MSLRITGAGTSVSNSIVASASTSNSYLELQVVSTLSGNDVTFTVYFRSYKTDYTNPNNYTWWDKNNSLLIRFNNEELFNGSKTDLDTRNGNPQTLGSWTRTISSAGTYNIFAGFSKDLNQSTYPMQVTQTITAVEENPITAPTNLQLSQNSDSTYTVTSTRGNNSSGTHYYCWYGYDNSTINTSSPTDTDFTISTEVGTIIPYSGTNKVYIQPVALPIDGSGNFPAWGTVQLFDITFNDVSPTVVFEQRGNNLYYSYDATNRKDIDLMHLDIGVSEPESHSLVSRDITSETFSLTLTPSTENEDFYNATKITAASTYRYIQYTYNSSTQRMVKGTTNGFSVLPINYEKQVTPTSNVYVKVGEEFTNGTLYVLNNGAWTKSTSVQIISKN